MKHGSLYLVITKDGDVVCECESLVEAAGCKRELNIIDDCDGVYEEDFYSIKRVQKSVS